MMLPLKRQRRNGQALIELAIVFPFFLLIVLGGIIDFGFAFYNMITLQQMADDAAQRGADDNMTASAIRSMVDLSKPAWWGPMGTVSIDNNVSLSEIGANEKGVRVSISYDSPVYTPFYQIMFSAGYGSQKIPLSAMAFYKIPVTLVNR